MHKSTESTSNAQPAEPPEARPVLLHVLLPIALGAAIYVLWRAESLLVFRWIDAAGLRPVVDAVRRTLSGARAWLPDWLLYSLPDALWVYAGVAFYAIVWRGGHPRSRLLWTALPALLALGGELGQLTGAVPGTFCPVDLALCALAWWAALTLNLTEKVNDEPQLAC
jgi:hypothetical protein